MGPLAAGALAGFARSGPVGKDIAAGTACSRDHDEESRPLQMFEVVVDLFFRFPDLLRKNADGQLPALKELHQRLPDGGVALFRDELFLSGWADHCRCLAVPASSIRDAGRSLCILQATRREVPIDLPAPAAYR